HGARSRARTQALPRDAPVEAGPVHHRARGGLRAGDRPAAERRGVRRARGRARLPRPLHQDSVLRLLCGSRLSARARYWTRRKRGPWYWSHLRDLNSRPTDALFLRELLTRAPIPRDQAIAQRRPIDRARVLFHNAACAITSS